ncbi:MAG: rubrerythrin family protein [Ruminococcus sp.]|nr:rubrerythrin family protein [Ruminococcus sp.]
MQIDFNESQTRINLMRAFAGECQARQRYYMSAVKAEQQKLIVLERMFKFTAGQEEQHAIVFFNLLKESAGQSIDITAGYPADVFSEIQQLLDSAKKDEEHESDNIYPEFAQIARQEGFMNIAEKFEMISKIENSHRERFAYYGQLMHDNMLFRSESTEEVWVCLNCGHIHIGSEPPQKCPVCDAVQGYFIREKEAPFTK